MKNLVSLVIFQKKLSATVGLGFVNSSSIVLCSSTNESLSEITNVLIGSDFSAKQ